MASILYLLIVASSWRFGVWVLDGASLSVQGVGEVELCLALLRFGFLVWLFGGGGVSSRVGVDGGGASACCDGALGLGVRLEDADEEAELKLSGLVSLAGGGGGGVTVCMVGVWLGVVLLMRGVGLRLRGMHVACLGELAVLVPPMCGVASMCGGESWRVGLVLMGTVVKSRSLMKLGEGTSGRTGGGGSGGSGERVVVCG